MHFKYFECVAMSNFTLNNFHPLTVMYLNSFVCLCVRTINFMNIIFRMKLCWKMQILTRRWKFHLCTIPRLYCWKFFIFSCSDKSLVKLETIQISFHHVYLVFLSFSCLQSLPVSDVKTAKKNSFQISHKAKRKNRSA